MASALEQFLGGVFNSNSNLKSYAHASRLYLDDFYKYAPKTGWIYYVLFNINSNTENQLITNFIAKNGNVIGMLVKSTDLPKFRMATEVLNQYNRKTYVQSKIEYQPIAMTFHDDHNNTSTSLWEAYYRYYFADDKENTYVGPTPPVKYGDIKYTPQDGLTSAYGLNNGIKETQPFFRSIELFQINRQQYTGFNLLNPIITDWAHDSLNQTDSKFLENKMTIGYEAVQYANGRVGDAHAPAFNKNNYDQTPSPLSILGKGNNSILGSGGVIPGITELLGGDTGGAEFAYPLGGSIDSPIPGKDLSPLQLAKGAFNLAKNLKNVSAASLGAEAYSIAGGALSNLASGQGIGNALGSLAGGSSNLAGVIAGSAGALGKVFNTGGIGNSTINGLTGTLSGLFGGKGGGGAGALLGGVTVGGVSGLGSPGASLAEQQAKLLALKQQIADSKAAKTQNDAELAAAKASGDPTQVDAVMKKMDSEGYTDPDELAKQYGEAEAAVADAEQTYMVQKQLDENQQSEDEAEADDPSDEPPASNEPPVSNEEPNTDQDLNNTQFADAGSGNSTDTTDYA